MSIHSLVAYGTMSDDELLAATRHGDLDAYAALWQRHEAVTRRIAASISRDLSAEDLVAEAYTRTFETIRRGSGPQQHFRAYLVTVVRRTAADWSKQTARTTLVGGSDDLAAILAIANGPGGETTADSGLLLDAFQQLPEQTRLLLWYSIVEGYRPREMAPLFAMSVGAVTVACHRARASLKVSWLQAYASTHAPENPGCVEAITTMGDFVSRRRLTKQHRRIADHLSGCLSCSDVFTRVQDVESQLHGILLPAAAVAGLVAHSAGGSTGSALAKTTLLSKPVMIVTTTLAIVGMTTVGLASALRPGDAPSVAPPSASQAATPPPVGPQPSPSDSPVLASPDGAPRGVAPTAAPAADPATTSGTPSAVAPPSPAGRTAVDVPAFGFAAGTVHTTRTPLISGTADPGATVTAVVSGGALGHTVLSATADDTGAWSITTPELDDATYDVRAYQTLASGSRSAVTSTTFAVDDPAPTPMPTVTSLDTAGDRFAPTASGTGVPGADVTVHLNGVPRTGVVQADGTWSVATGDGAVLGTNVVTVTQTPRGTALQSQHTPERQVTLVGPSATVSATPDGTVTVTVTSVPGSSLAVLVAGTTVHHVEASRGTDVITLSPSAGAPAAQAGTTIQVRYATEDASRVGPSVDAR